MNTETQLRGGIVLTLLALVILTFSYQKQSDELKKYQTDKNSLERGGMSNSELQDSLFILQTNLGRYEIALEMLKDKDSASAQKFEDILFFETE
jgi:hypothetical protein